MKTQTFVISAVVLTLLAVAQSRVINESQDDVAPVSIIDPIIKAILEKLRPKLANIAMDDINKEIKEPNLNATISVKNILVQNLDTFVIKNLKSTAVPLKITNLTLTWDKIIGGAAYDVVASFAIPELRAPVKIYAKGNARAALYDTFLTVGADVEMKGTNVQIKPKGLFGFDARIGKAEVSLSSLMGSAELGKAVGDFIGRIIPDAVENLKKPAFDAFHDTIVNILNEGLKRGSFLALDEEPELPETAFDDWDLEDIEFEPETYFQI